MRIRRLTKKDSNYKVRYVGAFFKMFTMIYLLFSIVYHLTSPTIAYLNDTEIIKGTLSFSDVFDENKKENIQLDRDLDGNQASEEESKRLEEKNNVQPTDKSNKENSTDVQEEGITEEDDIESIGDTGENMDAETVESTVGTESIGEDDLD